MHITNLQVLYFLNIPNYIQLFLYPQYQNEDYIIKIKAIRKMFNLNSFCELILINCKLIYIITLKS